MYAYTFECLALSLSNVIFKGNCYLLNWGGKSFGIIRSVELKHSPLALPVITVARTTFGHKCGICNRVTLRSLGTSRLHINSTGTPAVNFVLFDGTPKNSEELKNSTGYVCV
ncbi:hypothetical protein AVEN_1980-1 [Araneus ventricosus]|uniref:Uncharacterized protein n=1 Tax=Araneus ventricosus TaxID=182803 RepID=A0A4Y2R2M5_ARAVE|nr:hypothetical protein AVEN_1980-1 [Araneus ventricosus]